MDIPYHYLRNLLFFLLYAIAFWASYTLFLPDAGSMLGAILASALAAFVTAAISYATLVVLYNTARMAWKRELKPYLRRKFDKTPTYHWPDFRP